MGYSSTVAAGRTSEQWTKACLEQTGSQNTFEDRGSVYMFERGRENDDGAETGTVYRFSAGTHLHANRSEPRPLSYLTPCERCGVTLKDHPSGSVTRSGSYRIEPDGRVTRAPAFLKRASASRDAELRASADRRMEALAYGT